MGKKQLEEHFNVSVVDGDPGNSKGQRIELREEHGGVSMKEEDEIKEEEEEMKEEEVHTPAENEDEDVSMDDPAIPLGPGCSPHGVIRSYDPAKGFGFITCTGHPEDIYFP